jgi:hypothetical protein
MSDEVLVKALLQKNKARYGEGLDDGAAFEYFCAETILKSYSLTFDQLEDGIVDGKDDGGIDSVYFFVNRSLISVDTDVEIFRSPVSVDLFIIQSKVQGGFSETVFTKLQTSIPELISLDGDPQVLAKKYNSDVLEAFEVYRDGLTDLADQFPKVNIHIISATLSGSNNAKVEAMIPGLKKAIEEKFPKSSCEVELWDAARLYEGAKKQNVLKKKLPFVKSAISHGKGYVLLAKIEDYYNFITQDGNLIDAMFEFNVRDYQSSAAVNKEIAATLRDTNDQADFWWLNNGVTIIAEEAQSQDNKLTIQNPLIVNGLQTSHEIYRFFSGNGSDEKERSVQIRVLEIDDENRRDRVIKATNSQTSIKPASLHATEPFQLKIDDFLHQLGIYYDRRKDYWRNKGKPANRIVGIERLAQSVMAIMLERPHDARGRPTTLLKSDKEYAALFSDDTDLKIYQVCAEIFFKVDSYFKENAKSIDSSYRNNLRYHLMMQLAWELNGSRPVHRAALAKLKVSGLKSETLTKVFDHTISEFDKDGATDKVAKTDGFTQKLKQAALVKASSAEQPNPVPPSDENASAN